MFVVVQFMQGLSWTVFSSLPDTAKALFPGIGDGDLAWQVNMNNIAQFFVTPFAAWLLMQHLGMRRAIVGAGVSLALQSTLWAFCALLPLHVRVGHSGIVRVLLLAGAGAGGASSAFTQGACSRFSALWYGPSLRGRITGLAVSSSYLGQSAAFLLCTGLQTTAQLTVVLLVEMVVAIVVGTAAFVFFPASASDVRTQCNSRGGSCVLRACAAGACGGNSAAVTVATGGSEADRDGSEAEGEGEAESELGSRSRSAFFRDVRRVVTNRSCVAIVTVGAVVCGFFSNWQAALPLLTTRSGRDQHGGDWLAFASGVGYGLGGCVAGVVADRFFARQLKRLLCIALAACIACFCWVVLLWPSSWQGALKLPDSWANELVAVILAGAFSGVGLPVAMELLAEISYPVGEGTTGGAVMLLAQITATIFTALVPVLPPPALHFAMLMSAIFCFVLMAFVHEDYARLRDRQGAGNGLEGRQRQQEQLLLDDGNSKVSAFA